MASVEQWVKWMKAQNHSTHTITNRAARVDALARFTGADPADATEDDLIEFMASWTQEASTRATYFAQIRSWFAWLLLIDHRTDNPCARIKSPSKTRGQPREVKLEQLDAILAAPMRRRTRMMVLLAAYQGLRVHEIAKLKGEDVDLTGRTLRVKGKANSDATLPLHEKVGAYAVEVGFPQLGPWFPNHGGKPVTARSVSDTLADLMRRAKVPGGGHRLRHTFATQLQENGNSLLTTQTLMRHADPSSTAIYARVSAEQQREAIDGLR